MRKDLLSAAVAAFLLLSGDAFARQNDHGQPSQNQAQQSQQSQQAAPPANAQTAAAPSSASQSTVLSPRRRKMRWSQRHARRASRKKIKPARSRREFSTMTIFPPVAVSPRLVKIPLRVRRMVRMQRQPQRRRPEQDFRRVGREVLAGSLQEAE